MLADYHVHTEFSDDSDCTMEQIVEAAIDLGLNEICFTDHVDYGIKKDWDEPGEMIYRQGGPGEPAEMPLANPHYHIYYRTFEELGYLYGDKISLKFGLEFGVQVETIPRYQQLFGRYPFDFIILSVHQIENKEFWTQEFQQGKTQDEYIQRYYREILEIVRQYKDYSVLGHLDLINRYDKIGNYPFEKIKPVLKEILQIVIADGKGIEVNTSSHRYGLKDSTPSVDILKLYHQLGGRIVTIGSDSHKKEHLGAYIREAKRLLRNLGYREFCTFEKMQPIFHPLNI